MFRNDVPDGCRSLPVGYFNSADHTYPPGNWLELAMVHLGITNWELSGTRPSRGVSCEKHGTSPATFWPAEILGTTITSITRGSRYSGLDRLVIPKAMARERGTPGLTRGMAMCEIVSLVWKVINPPTIVVSDVIT